MSLLADLADLYDTTIHAATPQAAAPQPVEPTPTRVPYTAPGMGGSTWSGGQSTTSQLELTTAESTLYSVLELMSKTTARVEWSAHRPLRGAQKPGQEPKEITAEQNPAVALWHRPNNFMTGRFVRQMCTWHYRAVGEAWLVMDFWDGAMTVPKSWWPVRPDRMSVDPDPDEFLIGYTYTGPSGEKVKLDPREVLRITNPHPMDPHRGMGVVQALGTILGTALESAQWIANFFKNDATPGGIIELGLETELPEREYKTLQKRWSEQHRGTSKAHRVAILEFGKFVPRSYSMKDMQFPEIRQLSRDQILEAFRVHKHNMGISEDVNRANATAAREQLAENETKPNLDEWLELANGPFRERFGPVGQVVEFQYADPTPEDREENRADDKARVDNFVTLKGAGVDPVWAAEYVGMPAPVMVVESAPGEASDDVEKVADSASGNDKAAGELDETKKGDPLAIGAVIQKTYLGVEGDGKFIKKIEARRMAVAAGADIDPEDWEDDASDPAPVPSPGPVPAEDDAAAGPDPAAEVDAPQTAGAGGVPEGQSPQPGPQATPLNPLTAAMHELTDLLQNRAQGVPRATAGEDVDLSQMDEEWQAVLAALLAKWPSVLEDQYGDLARQVRDAVDAGDLEALVELVTIDAGAADALTLAMVAAAGVGAAAVVREAEAQNVDIGARMPEKDDLAAQAGVVTGLMRAGLAVSAGQAAMRVLAPGVSGEDVAEQVREHLDSLTDAQPAQHLGGALTMAQNAGRYETLAVAPEATYFASEQLDGNTCGPCRRVEGKMYDTLGESKEDYPTSGYRKCEGLERCRGTVVAVYTKDGDD